MKCETPCNFLPKWGRLVIVVVILGVATCPAAAAPNSFGFDTSRTYCAPEKATGLIGLPASRPIGALGALYFEDFLEAWPSRKIPFFIDTTVSGKPELAEAVRAAAEHISKRTIINFVEMTEADAKKQTGWIRVVDDTVKNKGKSFGCASEQIGYKQGEQLLWVGRNQRPACDKNGGPSIAHEFLHAAGMRHEQEHALRDLHIKIDEANLADKDTKYQWAVTPEKKNVIKNYTDMGIGYDFASLMHYSDRQGDLLDPYKPAFSIVKPDGEKRLNEIKAKEKNFVIGQRNCISKSDAAVIDLLYEGSK